MRGCTGLFLSAKTRRPVFRIPHKLMGFGSKTSVSDSIIFFLGGGSGACWRIGSVPAANKLKSVIYGFTHSG